MKDNAISSQSLLTYNPENALKDLDLSNNPIDDRRLDKLSQSRNLVALYLDGSNVTDVGAETLAQHSFNLISLNKTKITAKGALALSMNQMLKEVDLSNNNVGDEGIIPFAGHKNLIYLHADNTGLTDVSLYILAKNTPKYLTAVFIRGNSVTDKAIEMLRAKNIKVYV